jgi:hypothetical protein
VVACVEDLSHAELLAQHSLNSLSHLSGPI